MPDGWKAEVVDVSLSGLKVRGVAYLPVDQTFDATLVLAGGREVPVKVLVRWSTPPDPAGFVQAEAGLEVLEVTDAYRAALVELFAG